MEEKVLFRDRQEVGPDDINDMQDSLQRSNDHIVADAVTTERKFTGLQITKETSTSLRIGTGRLYQDGMVYAFDDELVMSVQNKLPVANRLILSVYAFGQTMETDLQERNFVTDTSVFPPTGVPEAVPMKETRLVNVNVVAGIESVDPLAPALPSNALLIATVMLTTTGIPDGGITRAQNNVLPNLGDHHQRLGELDVWRGQNNSKVDALTSEQAALSSRTFGKADQVVVTGIMTEMSRIKRILNLPSNNAPYDTDIFANADGIDDTLSAGGYRIESFGGADFPHAAESIGPLGLFNPFDQGVYRSGTDLVLPKFESVVAVETAGFSGEVNIGQYSVTTTVTKLMVGTKTETRYGWA
jgi:hypothetical protein